MLSLPPPGSSQLLLVWATWASAHLVSLLILVPKTCIINMRSRFLSHYSISWQITYIDSSSFWKVPKLFCKLQIKELTSCCMWKNNCEKLISAYPSWASSIFFSTCFPLFFHFFLLTEKFGIEALESRDSWLGALDKLSLKKKKRKKKRRRRRNSRFFLASSI